jgi:hypothetical protein
MKRILLLALAVAAIGGRARPVRADGFVGALFRPVVCLHNCDVTVYSGGVEGGYRYVALALRYTRNNGGNFLYPDVRLFYDFRLPARFSITPLLEITPSYEWGPDGNQFELTLRPGVRLGWDPVPHLRVFVEPVLIEFGVFTRTGGPSGTGTVTAIPIRYAAGAGLQYRF